MLFCVGSDGKGHLPFRCVCMMLLLAYLHVDDVPLGFEDLGALFTGSLHAIRRHKSHSHPQITYTNQIKIFVKFCNKQKS